MSSHILFSSINELLDPAFLSEAAGAEVRTVHSQLLTGGFAHSGSELRLVECELGSAHSGGVLTAATSRFVLKRLNRETDWLMRVTDDDECRSVTLWSEGILDRMPAILEPAVIACARDEGGWAILMRDLGEYFVTDRLFTQEQGARFLEGMAAMHATFFEDPAVANVLPSPGGQLTPDEGFVSGGPLGLSEIRHVYEMFAPRTARRRDAGTAEILERIVEGWQMVRELCPADVVDTVEPLLEDPSPLVNALNQYPKTLIHGDFRHSNLAALPDGRVGLVDWQLAAAAPPSVELGRYIGANSPFLIRPPEEILETYRAALERRLGDRFSEEWWVPQLELGMFGGFVQDGWAIALKATNWHVGAPYREHWKASLPWWVEQVRKGRRRLEG